MDGTFTEYKCLPYPVKIFVCFYLEIPPDYIIWQREVYYQTKAKRIKSEQD